MGWEVKQHGVTDFARTESGSLVTLMTPEPNGGYYKDAGVESFIRRFGYPDRSGKPDRLNFGGVYRVGSRVESTGLTMKLEGFNIHNSKIEDVTKGITLVTDVGEPAAIWGYAGLIKNWNRKHNSAVYLLSEKRDSGRLQYRYGPNVNLGEGTDFLLVLKAMAIGSICYDPGIKLEGTSTTSPKTKRRSQFRMKWQNLDSIYNRMTTVNLLASLE